MSAICLASKFLGLGDKTSISKDGENEAEMICEDQSRPIAQDLDDKHPSGQSELSKIHP
jgi:hypothetical protein